MVGYVAATQEFYMCWIGNIICETTTTESCNERNSYLNSKEIMSGKWLKKRWRNENPLNKSVKSPMHVKKLCEIQRKLRQKWIWKSEEISFNDLRVVK